MATATSVAPVARLLLHCARILQTSKPSVVPFGSLNPNLLAARIRDVEGLELDAANL